MRVKKAGTLYCAALLAAAGAAFANDRSPGPVEVVQGYVVHGVNVFNNEFISDYSNATPGIVFLNPQPPFIEIGALDPGAPDSETITADTDTSRLVATNRRFVDFFGIPSDPTLFNIPLNEVGTNFFGFTDPTDRIVPGEFVADSEPSIYVRPRVNAGPTIEEWNKIRGVVRYQCRRDGTARVEVAIRDAFPFGVYTMWDVGARNPLTGDESLYAVPLGGLPNILQADRRGCGHEVLEVPYCPGRPCEEGAESCSSYLSIAHHWDYQVYGASPGGSFVGVPVGAFAANHMVWPMSGDILMPPSTKLSGALRRDLSCP